MTEPTVHACPECGRALLHTCYHDGDDVSAKDMPVSRAIELTQAWIDQDEQDLEYRRADLARYKAMYPEESA